MTTTTAEPLRALGFSAIEAEAYVALLRESPATGYRLSHAIGKPTSNTYKAVQSLMDRGAVFVDDGESRLCRAVPPAELLAALERQFQRNKRRAADALAAVEETSGDERVYQVTTVESVWERARALLAEARVLALLDVMPAAFDVLRDDLRATAARGVEVWAKVYSEASRTPGVETLSADDPDGVLAFWPGCQVSLVVDARRHLLALLSKDATQVYQSIWSESVFLSCMQHNSLAAELLATGRGRDMAAASPDARKRLTLGREDLPGRRRLFERCSQIDAALR